MIRTLCYGIFLLANIICRLNAATAEPVETLTLKVLDVQPSGTVTIELGNSSNIGVRIWKESNSWGAARWRVWSAKTSSGYKHRYESLKSAICRCAAQAKGRYRSRTDRNHSSPASDRGELGKDKRPRFPPQDHGSHCTGKEFAGRPEWQSTIA